MTHAVRIVAVVAVLTALAQCVPMQAQTPAADALWVRAEAGDAEAQFNLGVRYGNGQGVRQDAAEAVRWYRLAADQGIAGAQYELGNMYALGVAFAVAGVWYSCSRFNSGGSISCKLIAPTGETFVHTPARCRACSAAPKTATTSGSRARADQESSIGAAMHS